MKKKVKVKKNSLGFPLTKANEFCQVLTEAERELMIDEASKHIGAALETLSIDVENDHNTKDTARRIAKMWVKETFKGRYSEEPKVTFFPNYKNVNQILFVGPIEIKSACSHHFVPFLGNAYVAVLPEDSKKGNVVGLSKFSRIINHFARRPQIQEELTIQIVDYLEENLKPRGIALLIEAQHMCCKWRGVEESKMTFTTSEIRGEFLHDQSLKSEFYKLIQLNKSK